MISHYLPWIKNKMTEPMYCAGGPNAGLSILESPNFPNNYPDSNTKQWNISVPTGHLELTFTNFSLEPWRAGSVSPCYDYVEVSYAGYTDQFCGSSIPGPFTSTDNTMTVKFHSDGSLNYPGFSAHWDTVEGAYWSIISML